MFTKNTNYFDMVLHMALLLTFINVTLGADEDKEMGVIYEDNPCAYTDCIYGYSCVAVTDPYSCTYPPPPDQTPCRKRGICVPNGAHYGRTCRPGGEVCPPGHSCEFVQVYCITSPCPPLLMCVDKRPPNPLQP